PTLHPGRDRLPAPPPRSALRPASAGARCRCSREGDHAAGLLRCNRSAATAPPPASPRPDEPSQRSPPTMPPLHDPSQDTWYAPLLERWAELPPWVQPAGGIVGALALLTLFVAAYRRVRPGRRLVATTVFLALVTTGLSVWALLLPETRGSQFILSHQVVRVGATLSATATVIGLLGLAVPRVLNFFEGNRFVTFVAARHVRSEKSGFLTV